MNIRQLLQERFSVSLAQFSLEAARRRELLDLVAVSGNPQFGDYQANLAMPLGKQLGKSPRDVAAALIGQLDVADLCAEPEVAGPGFINLRLRDDWLSRAMASLSSDGRLAVAPVEQPRTIVVDYSAPNVAKPMHVGHIRSSVIGDALYRTLKWLGHRVIGDNHLGDWGTQFGMIIYGFKHFLDREAYAANPVEELGRLYRLVNQLVGYHEGRRQLPLLQAKIAQQEQAATAAEATLTSDPAERKKADKALKRQRGAVAETRQQLAELEARLAQIDNAPNLATLAAEHAAIGEAVLAETARLHEGDAENLALWRQFMPPCLAVMDNIYRRLGITFDTTLGESFYHDRLASVVADLETRGLARESDGALCVFFEHSDVPMIVRKKDGAFLYATTDLATIQHRMETYQPQAILYVVDHRQSLHFEQLFAAARRWGYTDVELAHISFGTVLGDDGRPFKTRAGDAVGLTSLLDEAVRRAYDIVATKDDAKPDGPELDEATRQQIAETVGIAALKYADLSQNRTSDYVFSYDKMLAMEGNTATYMQYAYARVRSIFRRGDVDVEALRASGPVVRLGEPAERDLALALVRFEEALEQTVADYRPNQLTSYLYDVAIRFASFFEQCPVLKAPSSELRDSRLLLCDATARTLKQGLELLGIPVVEKM